MSAYQVGERVKVKTGQGHILNGLLGTVVQGNYISQHDGRVWVRVALDDEPRHNRVPFRTTELRRLRAMVTP